MARPMSLMIEGWMPSVGSSSSSSSRPHHQRPADGQLLLLAAGEVAAAPAEHAVEHRKQREHVVGNVALVARQRRKAGLEVFLDREQREDLAALRHDGDAAARALDGRQRVMSLPSKMIEPALTGCWPTMARSRLVLPTPLRPSTQVTLPGSALSEMPRSACAAP